MLLAFFASIVKQTDLIYMTANQFSYRFHGEGKLKFSEGVNFMGKFEEGKTIEVS